MNWFLRQLLRWTGNQSQPKFPHLYWLLNCSWLCQAVYVAAKLDIAELLRAGPQSASELAAKCGAQEVQLMQVLRALAGFGIFSQDSQGRFALNSQSSPLLRDADFSIHSYATVWGEHLGPAASKMLEQVRTGKSGFELAHGKPIWEFYRDHPDASDAFDTFMSDASDLHSSSIVRTYRFSQHQCIADIGAGRGSLISSILKSFSYQ